MKWFKRYKNYNERRLSKSFTGNETQMHYFEPQRKFFLDDVVDKESII